MDKLVNNQDPSSSVTVARFGHKEHLHKLDNDIDEEVKYQAMLRREYLDNRSKN